MPIMTETGEPPAADVAAVMDPEGLRDETVKAVCVLRNLVERTDLPLAEWVLHESINDLGKPCVLLRGTIFRYGDDGNDATREAMQRWATAFKADMTTDQRESADSAHGPTVKLQLRFTYGTVPCIITALCQQAK